MCLCTKNIKAYIAKEDIKVFKILRKEGQGYKTPYQNKEVVLGSVMKPDNGVEHKKGNYGYNNCTLCVEGGFIHAVTRTKLYDKDKVEDENYIVVECYIPKGTEFYFSDDFIEVAAKELYLSDKIVDNNSGLSNEEMQNLLLSYPIESLISKDKVSVGWLMLDDRTFVHPSLFNKDKMKPIGIVCEIVGNEYKIMSLNQTMDRWSNDYIKVEGLENLEKEDEIYADTKGKEHCEIISRCKEYKTGIFPAVEWCLNYVTNGINVISGIPCKKLSINLIFTSFLLGFGGISVLLQVLSITSKTDLSIKPYIYGKLLQGIFASFYTYILINIIPFFNFDI